jgi:hypothetical protein
MEVALPARAVSQGLPGDSVRLARATLDTFIGVPAHEAIEAAAAAIVENSFKLLEAGR